MIKPLAFYSLLITVVLTFSLSEQIFGQSDTAHTTIETIVESTVPLNQTLPEYNLQNTANILDMQRSDGFNFTTILRGLLGMLSLILIAFIFSSNRRAIDWKVIITGLIVQLLLAVGVLYVPWIQYFFEAVGKLFVLILDFTKAGTAFLFSSFTSNNIESALQNFVVQILPTIIFFSALTQA